MSLFDPSELEPSWQEVERRRQRRNAGVAVATVSVLVFSAIFITGLVFAKQLPEPLRSWMLPVQGWATQLLHIDGDWGPTPTPSAEISTLADHMTLTEAGRDTFYRTSPELVGNEVLDLCAGAHHSTATATDFAASDAGSEPGTDGVTMGCYTGADRIFLFQSADERLRGFTVTFAAHELLHAIYERMDAAERARVDTLVAAEIARVPSDDPVHTQIAGSVGDDETKLGTERFAYLGSQVQLEGGFSPALEAIYSRIFADRGALTAVYRDAVALLDTVRSDVEAAWTRVLAAETDAGTARAQYDADQAWHAAALEQYNASRAEYTATPEADRPAYVVSFTTRDGRIISTSWAEFLQTRSSELQTLQADLDAREPALIEQEAAAAALRAQTQAATDDANALFAAAFPTRS